jgi:ABC-type nitrate/sulfonate/bicarbonate transport system substrate-binding protein
MLAGFGSAAVAATGVCHPTVVKAQANEPAGGLAPPSNGSFLIPIIRKLELDKKHGLQLDIRLHSDQGVLYSDFAAGRSSHIFSAIFAGANFYERGLPVRLMFNYCTYNAAFASRDPKIKAPADLKGKTIVAPTSSGYYGIALLFLKQHGLDARRDLNILNAPPSGVQTYLLADKADAGLLFDPGLSNMLTKGFHLIGDINAGVRSALNMKADAPLWGSGVTAHKAWIDADPKRAVATLRMCSDAVDFLNKNPNEADQLISEFAKIPVEALQKSRELNITEWRITLPRSEKQNLDDLFQGFKETAFLKNLPDDGFLYDWPNGT